MPSSAGGETRLAGERRREPKYYRLKQHLEALTVARPAGSPVPTERALAAEFDTSRTTVRQAIQALVAEGRLERFWGRGTFVARPKISRTIQLTSYADDMTAQGLEPASRLLELRMVTSDAQLARRLDTVIGGKICRLQRLLLANGEPMAVETSLLPSERFPRLREYLPRYTSLTELLHEVYGVRLAEAQETIETALATPVVASLLATEVGMPLLQLSRHTFNDAGAPVAWVRALYRGDRYKFVTQLHHQSSIST
jgi:GntR family transcriptional regulator